jgi:DNA-binding XRE family transcriptional regulator
MKLQPYQLKIVHFRNFRKISQPTLARIAGISKGQMWKMEKEPRCNPTLWSLQKVAKALRVDIATLIS